jgi:hypothetical protein
VKNKIILALFLFFLVLGPLSLQCQQSFTLKKDIYVAKDEVQDNVVTFGGEVLVEGRVKESVIAFGGKITIAGEVGHLVLGFGTNILLKPTAVVKGDVASLGGSLEKEPGCRVDGDTIYFKTSEDIKELLKEGLKGILSISLFPIFLIFKLLSLSIWLLLGVLMAVLFPHQISSASNQIRKSFLSVFAIGFVAIIIFTGLAVFSALLSLILIGIPMLLALIFLAIVINIFARVTIFYFFGESLMAAFGKTKPSAIAATLLGLVLVSLITFIPILGLLISFFLSIIGWGATLKTKFGTKEG